MFITYKITNTITSQYYIGSHKTDNINDGYMGSGKLIRDSIKKYGIENHRKEILAVFDNRKDSVDLEHKLVKQKKHIQKDSKILNMTTGGFSFDYINNNLTFDRVKFGKMASHEVSKLKAISMKIKAKAKYYTNPNKCLEGIERVSR